MDEERLVRKVRASLGWPAEGALEQAGAGAGAGEAGGDGLGGGQGQGGGTGGGVGVVEAAKDPAAARPAGCHADLAYRGAAAGRGGG